MSNTITDPDEWIEWWASRNPFTNAYTREEIEFYGISEYDKDGVAVCSQPMFGSVSDYFNKAFHIGELEVPMLTIDKKLWMSITCMETQSQHLPILFASGNVATAGLGMGHFTLRCMDNPGVESITVFEIDERVISFFKNCFKSRPGFDKVKFVLGDARQTLTNYDFDFLYVDIYPMCLEEDVISDAKLFLGNNNIEPSCYHFWGQERLVLDSINLGLITMSDVPLVLGEYILKWFHQPVEGTEVMQEGKPIKLSSLYNIQIDPSFAKRALKAIDFDNQFI